MTQELPLEARKAIYEAEADMIGHEAALEESGLSQAEYEALFCIIPDDREETVAETAEALRRKEIVLKHKYLDAYLRLYGNDRQACLDAGITYKVLTQWRDRDKRFREREEDLNAALLSMVRAKSVEFALNDPMHNRWLLGKLMKEDFGDEPKKIEHSYKGAIDVTSTKRAILELMAPDDEEEQ